MRQGSSGRPPRGGGARARAWATVAGSAAIVLVAAALRAQAPSPPPKTEESPAGPRTVWDGVYTEEQAKRGEGFYRQSCAQCHGEALLGREMATPLTGPVFNSNWSGVMLGDLAERIRLTMPQTSPGSLSRQQNADIVAYILSVGRFPAGKTELARQTEIQNTIRYVATKP
jgi:mono/diheme cytochrome c family protein